MAVKCKINTDSDTLDVFIQEEPIYAFEYWGTAEQLASETNGEPCRLFLTSAFYLENANYKNSKEIGYGVLRNNKVI